MDETVSTENATSGIALIMAETNRRQHLVDNWQGFSHAARTATGM